jgi:PhnB protein
MGGVTRPEWPGPVAAAAGGLDHGRHSSSHPHHYAHSRGQEPTMKTTTPIPPDFHTITPYLAIRGAAAAMAFYTRAFGARETLRLTSADGAVVHAQMRIGDSTIMLAEEAPAWNAMSPQHYQGTPVTICLYVADVDALFQQAVAAGAKVDRPLTDQFYGDRTAMVYDPFGHAWHLATRKEDLTQEEMQRRLDEWTRKQQQQQQAQA